MSTWIRRKSAMNTYPSPAQYASVLDMPNNLAAIIKASGMTKRQVAAARGVTPETLSRHIHNKVPMTMIDAEAYANVLNTSSHHVLFATEPVPIIGHATMTENSIKREIYENPTHEVYLHDHYAIDTAALTWSCPPEYAGQWYEYDGAISFMLSSPIIENYVDPACIQKVCLVKFEEPIEINGATQETAGGVLYPQPGNRWTLHSPKIDLTVSNVKLQWATPFVQVIFRPDLRGAVISEIES